MTVLRRVAAPAALAALALAAACGGSRAPTRVVIVTLDTTRADRLGCYGYDKASTPNLDRLAAEAALFESAVSSVPTTLPSHSTMFTGQYPQDHGVRYNLVFRLGKSAVTLAEILRDHGFATAGFPAVYIVGKTFGIDQGFDTFHDPPSAFGPKKDPTAHAGRPAGPGVDQALRWLAERPDGERQFLWLHLYDPHVPYAPPVPYSSLFRGRPYDGEIAYMDAQLGRLFDALRASPRWAETLLIVVGDHGEGLYEHRERQHGNLIYETTQHVPLIVRAPAEHGRRVSDPVGLVDLFPTVLDYTGIPVPEGGRGKSLRRLVEGGTETPLRDVYFESLAGSLNYGWIELRGVRHGPWKLVWPARLEREKEGGAERLLDAAEPELYRVDRDPHEQENLASLEADRVAEMRSALAALAPGRGGGASEPALDGVLDPETERMLASLGYVTGGAGGSAETAPSPMDMIDLEPELLAGQSALAEGAFEQVENTCRYVLGRDPSNKWSLVSLAATLVNTGRAREGETVAAKLLEIYPDSEQGYFQLGQALKAQGRDKEAQQALDRGADKFPDSEMLAYYRLVNAFDVGRSGLCEDAVPAAVVRFAASGTMRVLLARCQARAGEPDAALKTLGEAVDRGFARVDRLAEADEFRELADRAEFRALVERTTRAGG